VLENGIGNAANGNPLVFELQESLQSMNVSKDPEHVDDANPWWDRVVVQSKKESND